MNKYTPLAKLEKRRDKSADKIWELVRKMKGMPKQRQGFYVNIIGKLMRTINLTTWLIDHKIYKEEKL